MRFVFPGELHPGNYYFYVIPDPPSNGLYYCLKPKPKNVWIRCTLIWAQHPTLAQTLAQTKKWQRCNGRGPDIIRTRGGSIDISVFPPWSTGNSCNVAGWRHRSMHQGTRKYREKKPLNGKLLMWLFFGGAWLFLPPELPFFRGRTERSGLCSWTGKAGGRIAMHSPSAKCCPYRWREGHRAAPMPDDGPWVVISWHRWGEQ